MWCFLFKNQYISIHCKKSSLASLHKVDNTVGWQWVWKWKPKMPQWIFLNVGKNFLQYFCNDSSRYRGKRCDVFLDIFPSKLRLFSDYLQQLFLSFVSIIWLLANCDIVYSLRFKLSCNWFYLLLNWWIWSYFCFICYWHHNSSSLKLLSIALYSARVLKISFSKDYCSFFYKRWASHCDLRYFY